MIINSFILFIFSLLFFYIGKSNKKVSIIFYLSFVLLFIFLSNFYYIFNSFTWNWFDNSVMYYFRYWSEWTWWWEYKKLFLIGFTLFFLGFLFIYFYYKLFNKKKVINFKYNLILKKMSFIFLILSIILHPLVNNIVSIYWFSSEKNIQNDWLIFSDFYKVPYISDIWKKMNFIYIYLESFEKIYTNDNIFPWLTPNINQLKSKSILFDNLYQAYWSSWTIAWMVWSQCWIPLELPRSSNISWSWYLSKAYCIGDYLHDAWYDLNYIWWAKLLFAWKWDFYKTHKFDYLKWKDELESSLYDKNYQYSWWLYDDTNFDNLYNRFDELSKKDKPFWLFTITMDTHWDTWVLSNKCNWLKYNDDKNSILNSYHCTDYLLSDFIERIKKHPNFKDTVIFIWSDHYAMENNNSFDIIDKNRDSRWLLFMIYDSTNKYNKIINKKGDTLDIWATVLSYLWFKVDELWLWDNLFNENINRDPRIFLSKWKREYEKFW